MYKKIAENSLKVSVMDILIFIFIPIPIYLVFKAFELYNPEDLAIYDLQVFRLCVLLHFISLFIWMYELGKSLLNVSSKTSKKTSLAFEVRNLIFIGILSVLLIYRLYMMFTQVWMVNGDGEYTYTFFRNMDLLVLGICLGFHLWNANQLSKVIAKIIRPRMRMVYLLALFFYPVGIFYIQPKMNKIRTRKAKQD